MYPRYFAAYEVTKKLLTPAGSTPSDLNLGAVIVAGGMAGIAMWSIAIPPDVRFCPLLVVATLIHGQYPGHQVAHSVRTYRYLLGFHGLCAEDDRCRWRGSALEGTWAGDGTRKSSHSNWYLDITRTHALQAFPANAATFVSTPPISFLNVR